jgi:hypothetical protein
VKCRSYRAARCREEAFELYQEDPTGTVLAAGATDLMVKARKKDWYEGLNILDISRIGSLKKIKMADGELVIGALATISDLLDSEIVQKCAPILALACAAFGVPQIRNRATIGGNLANACPAADCIPALCIMKATVKIEAGQGRSRTVPVQELVKPSRPVSATGNDGVHLLLRQSRGPEKHAGAGRDPYGNQNPCRRRPRSGILPESGEKIGGLHVEIHPGGFGVHGRRPGQGTQDMHRRRFCRVQLQDKYCETIAGTVPSPEALENISDSIADDILKQVPEADDELRYKAEVCRRLCRRTLLRLVKGESEK